MRAVVRGMHCAVNGRNNSCSKAIQSCYGQVHARTIKYLCPIIVYAL